MDDGLDYLFGDAWTSRRIQNNWRFPRNTGLAFRPADCPAAFPSGGFTALSFSDQTRNSAVSEVGYQASLDYGRWQPFARVVWDHELADTNRLVTASLTTIVAPSYSLPAVVLGKDWMTASLGTTFAIDRGITAYVTVSAQAAQNNVTTYGGQLGINVAFDALTRTAKAN
jgi:outer membrane lipase/esterase